MRLARETRVFY